MLVPTHPPLHLVSITTRDGSSVSTALTRALASTQFLPADPALAVSRQNRLRAWAQQQHDTYAAAELKAQRVCESTAAPIPVLPTLTAVLPAHSAHPVELHFTDPAQTWQDGALTRPVNLSTPVGGALLSAALLCPLPDGGGVLLADWRDSAALTLYVPAPLMADVRLALGLSGVTE